MIRRAVPLLALTAALGVAPPAESKVLTGARPGPLSYRLALVSRPALAKASPAAQASALSLPARGAGSLERLGHRYVVEVRVARALSATTKRLRDAGARVLGRSPRYRTISAAVPAPALRRAARFPRVQAVTEVLAPLVNGAVRPAGAGCSGSVTSEGVSQIHADTVQSSFGDTGAGVKVGILSDSFDTNAAAATHAANDVATGDLPGAGNPCGRASPVQVLQDSPGGADEGRAMLQIVHDVAPDAALAFATAEGGDSAFAGNIRALGAAGAKVIADDITYLDEPFFQEGPEGVAAAEVTAGGATYFSSAGNNNETDAFGHNISSWETPSYRDGGACPGVLSGLSHCLDFDPGPNDDPTFTFTIDPGARLRIDLQWAEPWFGVTDDLDLYILDSTDSTVLAQGVRNNLTTQTPFELAALTNTSANPLTVHVAINRIQGSGTPRTKFVLLQKGISFSEYPVSNGGDIVGPAIFSHNGGVGVITTAAVPFDDSSTVEPFSSHGPVTEYFGPVEDSTPAVPISPLVLRKPDISAPDCVANTFFGILSQGVHRFCGTSAAAPHAAGVAALQLQQNPSASPAQIALAQIVTGTPVGALGHDLAGAGLVDAKAAVAAIDAGPPAKAVITKHPKKRTRSKRATFKFNAPGAVAFQCRIDDGAFRSCGSPFRFKVRKHRKHTFRVRGVDNVGKIGPASKKFKWRVR